MSIFTDQRAFMLAMGQPVPTLSEVLNSQAPPVLTSTYYRLCIEELNETREALTDLILAETIELGHIAPVVDGAIDLIYVAAGLLNSLGVNADEAWMEVHNSNMSKRGDDGKVHFREDGKVLKPAAFVAPNILRVLREQVEKAHANRSD